MSVKREVWGEPCCDVKTRTEPLVVAFIFFVHRSTTSNKIDSNEVALAPESTISSPGADSETSYTDSVDLQIILPKEQKTEAKLQLHRECYICCE